MNTGIIKDLPKALINWHDFEPDSEVLFVSGGNEACEVIYEIFEEKGIYACKTSLNHLDQIGSIRFDYIVAAGIIETSCDSIGMLRTLRGLLKNSGKLLVGTENRLGMRYFCGDRDTYSNGAFDGIDGYTQVGTKRKETMKGRAYSKSELEDLLKDAGFAGYKFYSVMPCLTRPQMIISENYEPNEPVDVRIFPQYHSPDTVFLEEEKLYKEFMDNHMFHPMANAFLIECPADGVLSDMDQVTVQGDRSRNEAMATIIRKGKDVIKRALYPEGIKKVQSLMEKHQDLQQHNVPIIKAHLEGDSYVMPYIEGEIATGYFRRLLSEDREGFIKELENFRQIIVDSSEHVPYAEVNWQHFEPWWEKRKKDDPNIDKWEKRAFGTEAEQRNIGVVLRRGYVDMVSLNCFHTDKGFLFFDQEFYVEEFPANAIFIRTIDFIYRDRPDLELFYPIDALLKYFNMYEYRDTWRGKGNAFLEKLRNEKELSLYHRVNRRNGRTVASNRHRMNYSQEEYERLFTNIFKGAGNKKIFLFGSGKYAEKFMGQFGKYYEIAGILDNDRSRWGKNFNGIEIFPPSALEKVDVPFKVFICIKYFEGIIEQLKGLGVRDCSVYNPSLDYERPMPVVLQREKAMPKKYHIGYVAGVFDLFHIGHLNLIRRAKEQCDYLIVGVVSDEQVIKSKKTKPYISFQERLEIVQACRYVDEAVEIPAESPDTEAAFYRYHFDVQFSGSDYENEPAWLAKKAFLQQHGSDMVFFPYTEGTSSTTLKERVGGIGRRGERE